MNPSKRTSSQVRRCLCAPVPSVSLPTGRAGPQRTSEGAPGADTSECGHTPPAQYVCMQAHMEGSRQGRITHGSKQIANRWHKQPSYYAELDLCRTYVERDRAFQKMS